MKISARLLLGFMVVIGIVIAFSSIVFFSVRELTSYIDRLNEYGRQQAMAGDLRFRITWLAMPANDYIITGKREEYFKDFRNQASIVDEKFRDIEAGDISDEEREIVNEIRADYEEMQRLTQAIFNIKSPIGNQMAMRLMEEMDYIYAHPASEKATRLFDIIKEKRRKVNEAAKRAERRVITVVSAGIFISIIISSAIVFVIARSISSPLKEMTTLSQRIAGGDLSVAIEIKRMDEMGILAGAFNNMAVNLKDSLEKQSEFYKKLQQKVQQMTILHEAGIDITSDLAIEPILERLASYAAVLVKADVAAIVVLHPETKKTQYFKTNVSPEEFPVERFPEGKGLLGVVLREGIPLHLGNASADPRAGGLPDGHPPIGALTGIPLLSKSNLIFSLLMIDIDHFKRINDTYGHPAGDEVLRSMAKILKDNVRLIDIVGRYGGEEFSIILPETNIDGAKIVGERIRKAVAGNPFPINHGKEIEVTISIGISCFPESAQSVESLIERADQALYFAKKAGRNSTYFT